MKHFLLALFLFPVCLQAQNLVPNWNFEDTIGCPNSYSEVYLAKGWASFSQSPDYYNSCSKDTAFGIIMVGVPVNSMGFQYAASGNAYCGLYTYIDNYAEYREFIGGLLSTPLIVGHKYYVSLKVSLSDSSNCATNKIGIAFSTISFSDISSTPIQNQAKVYSNSIISDSGNWTTIYGEFIADSAYDYIIIGNFFEDGFTDTLTVRDKPYYGSYCSAYYYIGDVCVSSDSSTCNLPDGIKNFILDYNVSIYPNPANDILNIILPQSDFDLAICNLFGEKIYTTTDLRIKASINVSHFPNGIYFLQIKTGNNILYKQFIIQK